MTILNSENNENASKISIINTGNNTIQIKFNSNTKLYKPRLSVYSEVNLIPGSPRTISCDGTPSISIPVGGENMNENIDVIFEDGLIQSKMMRNDPIMSMMENEWLNNLIARNYYSEQGYWDHLLHFNFAIEDNGETINNTFIFSDDPGAYIIWDSSCDSILVNASLQQTSNMPDNRKVYFKFEFDCDDYSNHTHAKWGILTLKKDPVNEMNITWNML